MANQDERRVSKMLWWMVSKAAERSRRHRDDNCCDRIAPLFSDRQNTFKKYFENTK